MKKITISINKQGKWDVTPSPGLQFEDAVTMCLNGIYAISHSLVKLMPKEQQEQAKGQIYDSLNLAFGRFLDQFIPPTDVQLDDEAIKMAQQALIQESVDRKMPLKDIIQERRANAGKMS